MSLSLMLFNSFGTACNILFFSQHISQRCPVSVRIFECRQVSKTIKSHVTSSPDFPEYVQDNLFLKGLYPSNVPGDPTDDPAFLASIIAKTLSPKLGSEKQPGGNRARPTGQLGGATELQLDN